MEGDLLESIIAIGYTGPISDPNILKNALNDGIKSADFRQAIVWLAGEIRILGDLEEDVHEDEDANTFILELSSLLKELRCPHVHLITGHVSDRLQDEDSRILLLDFLITELMSLKMYIANRPQDTSNIITIHETPTAAALKDLTISLNMGKPPDNIAPKMLFDKIASRLDEVIKKAGPKRLGKPLFNPSKTFTPEQWKILQAIQQDLDEEYDLRRRMFLSRLDVTIQSFQWSDRLKGKEDDISKQYTERRKNLDLLQSGSEETNISAMLAARESLAIIEKTSNSSVRKFTKSKIQRHIIGQVPDRGGRAHEHQRPPPEMPPWLQRGGMQGGGQRGGGRGGGGRGGGGDRGGRGRGGGGGGNYNNNQQSYNNQQSSYSGGGGGGGGGNYQQQQQNYQQQNQYQSQSGNNQYNQQSYDNRGGGGGRVQGGWSQRAAPNQNYNSSQSQSGNGGNSNNSGYSSQDGNFSDNRNQNRGGLNDNRGQSNYNRGGGGGGNQGGRSNYNRGGGGGGGGRY